MKHPLRQTSIACVAAGLTLLLSLPQASRAEFSYPTLVGTGNLTSDAFFTLNGSDFPERGLFVDDARNDNRVGIEFDLASSRDGRITGLALMRKEGLVSGEVESATVPVRGRARWQGEVSQVTRVDAPDFRQQQISTLGRANLAGRGGQSRFSLKIVAGYEKLPADMGDPFPTDESFGLSTGRIQFDRDARGRHEGFLVDWVPELGSLLWSREDMIARRPGKPVRRGSGLLISGMEVVSSNVTVQTSYTTRPERANRPGVLRANVVGKPAKVRGRAQHDFYATREMATAPGFDWREIMAPVGAYQTVSRSGVLRGLIIILPPSEGEEPPILILSEGGED